MFERLEELEKEYEEVAAKLADPQVASRPDLLRDLGKRHAELGSIVAGFRELKQATKEAEQANEMLEGETDPEMKALVAKEVETQEALAKQLEEKLRELLLPKDPDDDRNVIVEVKAGEGGDESALFAGDLFRMYNRYAERGKWKTEVLATNPSDRGGFKDVTFAVKGDRAYSRWKHEAGVHRVQRVPDTESQGRIHTSAVGVLVLPEAEDVDVRIDPNDLEYDTFRSSGPGGQSVNTTDSAVRLTHKPTGLVVTCQDEKSQLQNKDKAMRIMRTRIYQLEIQKREEERGAARRSQVRSVDRSEKIRTYNFPQNRVTDHRVGLSIHNLPEVLDGDLDQFIDALIEKERADRLKEQDE